VDSEVDVDYNIHKNVKKKAFGDRRSFPGKGIAPFVRKTR
jgi:hypothetical protein